jgi:predicted DNA-binding transcriptional regulator AlpA
MPKSNDGVLADKSGPLFADAYSRLLDKKEFAQHIGKSESSVDRMRKRRLIPYIVAGGTIRFRLKDVERALSRYEIKEVSLWSRRLKRKRATLGFTPAAKTLTDKLYTGMCILAAPDSEHYPIRQTLQSYRV